MGNTSDTSAQTRMSRAYLKLKKEDPENELLSLVAPNPSGDGFYFGEAYRNRFVDPIDEAVWNFGLSRYALALEEAISE